MMSQQEGVPRDAPAVEAGIRLAGIAIEAGDAAVAAYLLGVSREEIERVMS